MRNPTMNRKITIVIVDINASEKRNYVRKICKKTIDVRIKSGYTSKTKCIWSRTGDLSKAMKFETYDAAKRELTKFGLNSDNFKLVPVLGEIPA